MQTSRHLKKNHKKSTKAHKRTRKIKVSIKKKKIKSTEEI